MAADLCCPAGSAAHGVRTLDLRHACLHLPAALETQHLGYAAMHCFFNRDCEMCPSAEEASPVLMRTVFARGNGISSDTSSQLDRLLHYKTARVDTDMLSCFLLARTVLQPLIAALREMFLLELSAINDTHLLAWTGQAHNLFWERCGLESRSRFCLSLIWGDSD